jgi:hypothetical protein
MAGGAPGVRVELRQAGGDDRGRSGDDRSDAGGRDAQHERDVLLSQVFELHPRLAALMPERLRAVDEEGPSPSMGLTAAGLPCGRQPARRSDSPGAGRRDRLPDTGGACLIGRHLPINLRRNRNGCLDERSSFGARRIALVGRFAPAVASCVLGRDRSGVRVHGGNLRRSCFPQAFYTACGRLSTNLKPETVGPPIRGEKVFGPRPGRIASMVCNLVAEVTTSL